MLKFKFSTLCLTGLLSFSLILHIYFALQHTGSNFNPPDPSLKQQDPAMYEFDKNIAIYGSRDAYLYAKTANQFLDTGIYGFDGYQTGKIVRNATVTPGYPIYLIILFSIARLIHADYMVVATVANIALSVSTILLIYLVAQNLFKRRLISLLSAGLYATYFSPLHFVQTTLTEIPAIFLYLLALYFYIRAYEHPGIKKRYHILFSVFFCLAIFIRPVLSPVVIFGFLLMAIKHRWTLKSMTTIGALWFIGPLITFFPWVLRNYFAFKEFILFSTNSGNSWFAGANPFYLKNGESMYKEMYELGMDEKTYGIHSIKKGFIENFNLWFSWFTVGKTYELFKTPDSIYFYRGKNLWLFVKQHYFIVYTSFLSLLFFRNKRFVAITIVFLAYIGLSNLFFTIPRYGFYVIPIMCLMSGYGVYRILIYINSFLPPDLFKKTYFFPRRDKA